MLTSKHNRRIGGEAADLNLRGSREGPQKTDHSHSEQGGEGRRTARAGLAEAKICLFPHKWMQPVPVHSHRQDAVASRGIGDVAFPFWAALHLS